MAYTLFEAIFIEAGFDLARTVGAERVAECRNHDGVIAATLWLAWLRGFSPLEMVSEKADAIFIAALRQRFPRRGET